MKVVVLRLLSNNLQGLEGSIVISLIHKIIFPLLLIIVS